MSDRPILNMAEVAAALGVTESTANRWIAKGMFPVRVIEVGARRKVLRSDLERFLAGEQVAS